MCLKYRLGEVWERFKSNLMSSAIVNKPAKSAGFLMVSSKSDHTECDSWCSHSSWIKFQEYSDTISPITSILHTYSFNFATLQSKPIPIMNSVHTSMIFIKGLRFSQHTPSQPIPKWYNFHNITSSNFYIDIIQYTLIEIFFYSHK